MNIANIASDASRCCGCGACAAVCKRHAIIMQKDSYGNTFPRIIKERCSECSMCVQVCCSENESEQKMPIVAYAATYLNAERLSKSSSGGIFAALAEQVIAEGGIVYGAAFTDSFSVEVVGIENVEELPRIQGSKYVQSSMGDSYHSILLAAKSGRKVLFGGVPCQVAAVKQFLKKEYDNVLLVDIVCHGVPNGQMFEDYLDYIEKKHNIQVQDYCFRNKTLGQDTNGKIEYVDLRKKKHMKKQCAFRSYQSSYYKLFLNCSTFRDSCYSCKFAQPSRVGDLTLCDYWGIDEVHPDFEKKVKQSGMCGISGVLVNTEKGRNCISSIWDRLLYIETNYADIRRYNPQLNAPSSRMPEHDTIMELYRNGGFGEVDRYYYSKYRRKIVMSALGQFLPHKVKKQLLIIKRGLFG